jgi:DNA-binding response OmpR family regulator
MTRYGSLSLQKNHIHALRVDHMMIFQKVWRCFIHYNTRSSSHMNILIIEDDNILASQIARIFYSRIMTHRIDVFTSVEKFYTHRSMLHVYDIILVDLRLSHETRENEGYAIIETIHKINPETPIIVISGIDNIETLRHAFFLGAVDYIVKPFRLAELEVRVDHWFSRFYIDPIHRYTHESILNLRYNFRENEFYK